MHMPLAATLGLILAAAVLSGCTAPDPRATVTSTGPAPPPAQDIRPELKVPTALAEVQLGRADIGSEPNIAASPNGTLYISTPLQLWRSTDSGKTYTALGAPACPVVQQQLPQCAGPLANKNPGLDGGGDGDIAVDSTGRIHWVGLFGPSGPIPYQTSTDMGETFGQSIDISDGTGRDRQWIDITPEDHIFAAWRDSKGYVVNRSLDGGATWEGKVKVSDDVVGGPIIHDPSDPSRLYIPSISGSTLAVARSEDEGATWKTLKIRDVPTGPGDVGFATSIFPVAAADDNGTLYVVVSHKAPPVPDAAPKSASQYAVFLYVSHDHGTSWSSGLQVSPDLKVAILPWVAAGKPGRIAVTYYQNTVGLPNDNLPDLWNVFLLESVTADAAQPAFAATQLNGMPNHVGSVCTSGSACLLTGGDRSLLDFFELVIPADGQPKVTWSGDAETPPILSSKVYAGGIADGTPLR